MLGDSTLFHPSFFAFHAVFREKKLLFCFLRMAWWNKKRLDFLAVLPSELSLLILQNCDVKTLATLASVSHGWRRYTPILLRSSNLSSGNPFSLAEDVSLWRKIYLDMALPESKNEDVTWKELVKQLYQEYTSPFPSDILCLHPPPVKRNRTRPACEHF